MHKSAQKGIAHVGLLLLVLVAAVTVFAGYKLEQSHKQASSPAASTAATSQASQIPSINSKADLNKAETALNNENIDGDLNPDSYNQDVSSLQ